MTEFERIMADFHAAYDRLISRKLSTAETGGAMEPRCSDCGRVQSAPVLIVSRDGGRRCDECWRRRHKLPPQMKPTTVADGSLLSNLKCGTCDTAYPKGPPASGRCSCGSNYFTGLFKPEPTTDGLPWAQFDERMSRKREDAELQHRVRKLENMLHELERERDDYRKACEKAEHKIASIAQERDRAANSSEHAKTEVRALRKKLAAPHRREEVTWLVQAVEAYMHTRKRGLALDVEKTEREVWRAIRAVVSEGSERK